MDVLSTHVNSMEQSCLSKSHTIAKNDTCYSLLIELETILVDFFTFVISAFVSCSTIA